MNSMNDDQTSSCSSDIDICNTSPNSSPKVSEIKITSTPYPTYKPQVNFHSIESLAISSLNTSSLTPISSPCSFQRHDDTGYSSLSSSSLAHDKDNKENVYCSTTTTTVSERKPRRKLTDWQIWHLRQAYLKNRYPSPYEQEQLAVQLLLPLSSIRIWFQNYRARSGKK
ncbi:unnamed protein product [Rotaria sp. Silwood2]|nr:unnamed protein product [Rotaria sp. Silwood2]CAF2669981.1 unnamed protein product [Rotaria sp. Silwood2]CAF2946933.1 unnamed protein product [Rotaria sp. Silwood2]CAF3104281.1 unnamed protein product [Rotaria sp. Silwood2]CAF3971286.1 unnamed protein product [Rotaria sp. Silwood2]